MIEAADVSKRGLRDGAAHRQGVAPRRPHQIDIVQRAVGGVELAPLAGVEDVKATDLQPATVVVSDVEAVCLRQLA